MQNCFRTEVFELCKKCKNNDVAKEISNLFQIESTNNGPKHSDTIFGELGVVASHFPNQFLGYLKTDEMVANLNKQHNMSIISFSEEERFLIEIGHKTINCFIDSCLEELKEKYPQICNSLIHPYSVFQKPTLSSKSYSLLSKDDLNNCKEEFKKGKIYRAIIENDALSVIERKKSEETVQMLNNLSAMMERQYNLDYRDITRDTKEYFESIDEKRLDNRDTITIYTILCHALKQELSNASQMIFEAIIGEKLMVFNNNNIISFKEGENNRVYEKYTVLIQGALMNIKRGNIRSIVLIDCEEANGKHFKEFGRVFSETISFSQELGSTTKLQIATVDTEINSLHVLTDYLVAKSRCKGEKA